MLALLLLSGLGRVAAVIHSLEALVIKDTFNGNAFDVGWWGPVSMSSDGSKAVAATNGYAVELNFVWASADGRTFTKTSEAANEVVMTRDGSKMLAVRIDWFGRSSGHKIRLSSDGGASWSDTGAADTVKWGCLAVSSDGSKMAAAGWDGNIWLSSDTGATWTDTGVGPQKWHSLAMSGDGRKMAAGTEGAKIWISTDSGSTFTEAVATQANKWRVIAMTPDGSKIAAAAEAGGVWVSSDDGVSWTQALSADSVYRGVAISDDGMTIVANGGRNRMSTDGGASFGYIDQMLNKQWERAAITGNASKVLVSAMLDGGRIYLGDPAATTTTRTTTTAGEAAVTETAETSSGCTTMAAVGLMLIFPFF